MSLKYKAALFTKTGSPVILELPSKLCPHIVLTVCSLVALPALYEPILPVCTKFATLIPHISTEFKPADTLPFQIRIPLVAPNASLIYIPFSHAPRSEEKSYVIPDSR